MVTDSNYYYLRGAELVRGRFLCLLSGPDLSPRRALSLPPRPLSAPPLATSRLSTFLRATSPEPTTLLSPFSRARSTLIDVNETRNAYGVCINEFEGLGIRV